MDILIKLHKSFKERGVKHTLIAIYDILTRKIRILADFRFDRRFGVNTSGRVFLKNLDDLSDAQKSAGSHYESTSTSAIQSMLKGLMIDHSKYTLIDFGSGKGRVLLLASEYPYNKIIGVEFSQSLHRIAENNIKIWNNSSNSRQKCFNIESVCIDALDFKLPQNPLVIYFFAPFHFPVAGQIINNIQESFKNNPRPMKILYYGTSQRFIESLMKLNFPYQEIYNQRPFTATKRYKGLIFSTEGLKFQNI